MFKQNKPLLRQLNQQCHRSEVLASGWKKSTSVITYSIVDSIPSQVEKVPHSWKSGIELCIPPGGTRLMNDPIDVSWAPVGVFLFV